MSESGNISKANELLERLSGDIKKLPVSTGDDDFRDLLNGQSIYVDKTLLVKEVLDSRQKVVLITRPRRWGKTLGMSMLKYFLGLEVDAEGKEIENNSNRSLFDNLEITKTDKINEQGKHPVIFITLKDVDGSSYKKIENQLMQKMAKVFWEFTYIEDAVKRGDLIVSKPDIDRFDRILNETGNDTDITNSIELLSRLLFAYHGKKPFLLIDEYDVPLNNSYDTNYYDSTLFLIKSLFGAGIKGNSCIKKCMVTGVFKIAKSGLWTGMNNSVDHSILSKEYAQYFGFTENEVEALLQKANIQNETIKSTVKEWYNGYNIGGLTMYNPWSIINFLSQLRITSYWINTESSVSGGKRLSTKIMINEQMHDTVNLLIANFGKETIAIKINPEVVFDELSQEVDSLWGLLLFGGYLSIDSFREGDYGLSIIANAKIPNKEILRIFEASIVVWVQEKLSFNKENFDSLCENFNLEDLNSFRITINKALDMYGERIATENESIFHGLIQSLCLLKGDKHQVASESRSGRGRIDSIFYPVADKSDTIIIHEYKIVKNLKNEAQLKEVLTNAIWQIYSKIYMKMPLLNNKYFDGRCSAVELRAIVILCNPNIGAEKKFICRIMTRSHPIAEMEEIAKVFQADPQDRARIASLKSEVEAEVEKYMAIYM